MTLGTAAPTTGSGRHRLTALLSLIAMAVALLAAVASTEENEPSKVDEGGSDGQESTEEAEGDQGPQVFAVGDLVELGDWQVKVHEVTDPVETTNEFLTPSEGNRWVAIDVEVTNTSDEAGNVSSLLCFELQDSQNISYDQTITGSTDAATPDGEVPPGGSRRGILEYEVPTDAEGLRVNFKCDLLSSGSATIAL